MRCKAEIYVGEVEDAIYVPLQAVFREGSDAFVYVPDGSGFSQQRVDLGRASGLHVEITDGLSAGEVVLLREPKVNEIVTRLPAAENGTNRAKSDKPRRPGHDRAAKTSNRQRRGKGA
jgi:multidrug efflux pump subunit AcrA (membrane-fusion protein)